MRRHAEDGSGLGEEWDPRGNHLYSPEHRPGNRDVGGVIQEFSAAAGEQSNGTGIRAIAAGVSRRRQEISERGEGVVVMIHGFFFLSPGVTDSPAQKRAATATRIAP